MTNEAYAAVIDEFAAAVYEAAGEMRPATADRLSKATGDLLEALAQRSTMLVAGVFVPVVERLDAIKRELARLERRLDTQSHDITEIKRQKDARYNGVQARVDALEKQLGGGDADAG